VSFRIVKIHAESGSPVRCIPVIYSCPNQATTDAAILNNRREFQQSGFQFIVREVVDQSVPTPAETPAKTSNAT
jgi:hypothetical protein